MKKRVGKCVFLQLQGSFTKKTFIQENRDPFGF